MDSKQRRLASLALGLALVVTGGAVVMGAVTSTTALDQAAIAVARQDSTIASATAASTAFVDVPGATVSMTVPQSTADLLVARFQAGEVPVFLLSLKAGGTGLNLTGADHVVHFDRWWNPAVEDQASDRAYRIGQTRPVQVHRMVTTGTIEQRIAELLGRKRDLADSVLTTGETALTELSNDELRDLVTLRQPSTDGGA